MGASRALVWKEFFIRSATDDSFDLANDSPCGQTEGGSVEHRLVRPVACPNHGRRLRAVQWRFRLQRWTALTGPGSHTRLTASKRRRVWLDRQLCVWRC